MQAQAKYMNSTWLTNCGGRSGRVWFQGAKKLPVKGEELNSLVSKVVKEVIKSNNHTKSTAVHDSGSEEELENFNF